MQDGEKGALELLLPGIDYRTALDGDKRTVWMLHPDGSWARATAATTTAAACAGCWPSGPKGTTYWTPQASTACSWWFSGTTENSLDDHSMWRDYGMADSSGSARPRRWASPSQRPKSSPSAPSPTPSAPTPTNLAATEWQLGGNGGRGRSPVAVPRLGAALTRRCNWPSCSGRSSWPRRVRGWRSGHPADLGTRPHMRRGQRRGRTELQQPRHQHRPGHSQPHRDITSRARLPHRIAFRRGHQHPPRSSGTAIEGSEVPFPRQRHGRGVPPHDSHTRPRYHPVQ